MKLKTVMNFGYDLIDMTHITNTRCNRTKGLSVVHYKVSILLEYHTSQRRALCHTVILQTQDPSKYPRFGSFKLALKSFPNSS